LKVLQVVADGDPGGGTTHVLQLLEWLRAESDCLLITEPGSYLADKAAGLGVKVRGVDMFRTLRAPLSLRTMQAAAREFKPDLVHAHGSRAATFVAVALPRILSIYTVHGFHFLGRPGLASTLRSPIERYTMSRFDFVIFVSGHDARNAERLRLLSQGQESRIIHNGVPLFEVRAGPPNADPPIGFVGRLEYPKDPMLFLDVAEKFPDVPAIMVGDGGLTPLVQQEIARRALRHVRLVGAMTHEGILSLLPDLAVLVITSRWEAFGLVAAEAMWAGVPVVAADVGGLSEVIEHGESGLLVEGRDPDVFAEAVRRLLGDRELRRRMTRNARERVRALFSQDRMLEQTGQVYASLLGRSPDNRARLVNGLA
jgi:glycosyltransferase involved in cell wall biosynthesis